MPIVQQIQMYHFGLRSKKRQEESWEPAINRSLQTILLLGIWITIIYIAVRVNDAFDEHIIRPQLPQKAEKALNGIQKIQAQINDNTIDQVKRIAQRADHETEFIEQHNLLPMMETLANEIHRSLALFSGFGRPSVSLNETRKPS
jgi:hypothetical protein